MAFISKRHDEIRLKADLQRFVPTPGLPLKRPRRDAMINDPGKHEVKKPPLGTESAEPCLCDAIGRSAHELDGRNGGNRILTLSGDTPALVIGDTAQGFRGRASGSTGR
jgi:hypothetical protein